MEQVPSFCAIFINYELSGKMRVYFWRQIVKVGYLLDLLNVYSEQILTFIN